MTSGQSLLDARDITVRFGGLYAVRSVDFQIQPGEIKGLIGPNGSGKTSTFNVLSGIYRPSSGSVRLGETDLLRMPPHSRAALGITRTFQNLQVFGSLSALDNVLVGMHSQLRTGLFGSMFRGRRGVGEEQAHEEALRLLDLFQLRARAHTKASNFSFGEQRWLELARALAAKPRLLLLDEPTSGMSHAEAQETSEVLKRIRSEYQMALFVVEHNMAWIFGLCDSLFCLNFGQKIAEGAPNEVRNNPTVIDAYLGLKDKDRA